MKSFWVARESAQSVVIFESRKLSNKCWLLQENFDSRVKQFLVRRLYINPGRTPNYYDPFPPTIGEFIRKKCWLLSRRSFAIANTLFLALSLLQYSLILDNINSICYHHHLILFKKWEMQICNWTSELKFQVSEIKCLLDLKFDKGVFKMSCYHVHDTT